MAGRNKKKKVHTYTVELNDETKTLKISFDEKGDCKIMILNSDFETTFNIPESSTHQVRLLFFDNYKRHHVWKTRNQRKAERMLENIQDVQISNDIVFPDLNFDILPDIIDMDGKQK